MKKGWIACLSIVLLLTGCGGKEKTTVCKSSSESEYKEVTTIDSKGDEINTVVLETTFDMEKMNMSKEYVEGEFKKNAKKYNDIKGVKYKYKFDGNNAIQTHTMKFSEDNMDALLKAGLINSSEKDIDFISLESTIKGIEKQGRTCK